MTGSLKAETWEALRAVVDSLEAVLKELSATDKGSRLKDNFVGEADGQLSSPVKGYLCGVGPDPCWYNKWGSSLVEEQSS